VPLPSPLQNPSILILDDDPSHLKIYSWIVEQAEFRALPVQVTSSSLNLPIGERVDLVLMDYRYSSSLTAADIVTAVENAYPGVPIAVLSELYGMPHDMKGHAVGFIRKGEPQELVNRLQSFRQSGILPQAPTF
jgi:DNA-binding NtrC family response regulator